MLLGREQERLAIDRVLTEARAGRSGVLALVGEAGIGKTALLEYAVDTADGMRLLRARGVESETEVPFAGLGELLRPALDVLDRIPRPQAQALAGALALAPARAGDRFAIGAATLSLLAALSEQQPLLLVVDDAHRLDASSAEALLFALRRLMADPVAVLLAVREGERSLLDGADLRALRVAGLDRGDAAQLLAGRNVHGEAVERLYLATGGNPLALLELAPEARRLASAPPVVPVPISTSIAEVFTRRIRQLDASARRLLILAAASNGSDVHTLARAAGAAGLEMAQLGPAEDARLVTIEGPALEFRHPLARSAVYADASAGERREAHALLAAAQPEHEPDRRAWHMAAAALGPDAEAAAALRAAGGRARERSAYGEAAAAFERAAALAVDDVERGELLAAAADAGWLAGDGDHALRLLEAGRPFAQTPELRARMDQLYGRVAMRRGPLKAGSERLEQAAAEIADSDPELAVTLLAEAVYGWFYAGATERMAAAAERAAALAASGLSPRASAFAALAQGVALVAGGRGEEGAAAVRRSVEILEGSEDLRDDPALLAWISLGPLWLREADTGRALMERALERARTTAAIGILPSLLHNVARDQATTDQWQAAHATYHEAVRLGRETGQPAALAAALAGLAWLEARQGREQSCREHAAEAGELCAALGLGTHGVWTIAALGDLELALGRPEAARGHFETQARTLAHQGIHDVDLSPEPELVDVYLRLGEADAAAAAADAYQPRAEEKGQPWALARAWRCRGLVADADAIDSSFTRALQLHAQTPDQFEAARTQLAYGGRLRRARRRVDARQELRAALSGFEQLGAEPWAQQARAELAATGETARRRDVSTLDQLTPQELQIARLLAAGRTTREAAAAFFLSPKTIEYHLRSVYRKLDIHSREELARVLGA